MLPYGPVGAVESLARWLRLSQQGTTLGRMGMQSLADFAFFFKWPSAWIAVATGLCVCAVLLALRRPARPEIWRSVLLCVAGMLTSGVLTFGLYPSWLWFIGQANYTWGSLLLLAALVIDRVRRPQPVPSTT